MKTDTFKILNVDESNNIVSLFDNVDKKIYKMSCNSQLELSELKTIKNNIKEVEITHDEEKVYYVGAKLSFNQTSYIRNFVSCIGDYYKEEIKDSYGAKDNFHLLMSELKKTDIKDHKIVSMSKMNLDKLLENVDNRNENDIKIFGFKVKDEDMLDKIGLLCVEYDGVNLLINQKNEIINMKDNSSVYKKYTDLEFIRDNISLFNNYKDNIDAYYKLDNEKIDFKKYEIDISIQDCLNLFPSKESKIFLDSLLKEVLSPGTFTNELLSNMYSSYKKSIPLVVNKKDKLDEIIDFIKRGISDENINLLYDKLQTGELKDLLTTEIKNNGKSLLDKDYNQIEQSEKLPNGSFLNDQVLVR